MSDAKNHRHRRSRSRSRSPVRCQLCNKFGHAAFQCFKFRSNNRNNKPFNNHSNKKTRPRCEYPSCRKFGHTIEVCRKKIQDEESEEKLPGVRVKDENSRQRSRSPPGVWRKFDQRSNAIELESSSRELPSGKKVHVFGSPDSGSVLQITVSKEEEQAFSDEWENQPEENGCADYYAPQNVTKMINSAKSDEDIPTSSTNDSRMNVKAALPQPKENGNLPTLHSSRPTNEANMSNAPRKMQRIPHERTTDEQKDLHTGSVSQQQKCETAGSTDADSESSDEPSVISISSDSSEDDEIGETSKKAIMAATKKVLSAKARKKKKRRGHKEIKKRLRSESQPRAAVANQSGIPGRQLAK